MIIRVTHELRYSYSAPVFCEPMELRLHPRTDDRQQLREFSLAISPSPTGRAVILDEYGNRATRLWFSERIESLEVRGVSETETIRDNPFDALLEPRAVRLPVEWTPEEQRALAIYFGEDAVPTDVTGLASEVHAETDGESLRFLLVLAERIAAMCEMVIRPEGPAWPPEETLTARRGSCRDLAMLYVAACRAAGLPARFVSGYQRQDSEDPTGHELHAWAEAYLPGGGWRAFDPSEGLAVRSDHVTLACAPQPERASPILGSYRGNQAESLLETGVTVVEVTESTADAHESDLG